MTNDERDGREEPERRLFTRRELMAKGGSAAGAVGLVWLLAACGGGGGDEAATTAAPAETGGTQTAPPTETVPAGGGEVDIDDLGDQRRGGVDGLPPCVRLQHERGGDEPHRAASSHRPRRSARSPILRPPGSWSTRSTFTMTLRSGREVPRRLRDDGRRRRVQPQPAPRSRRRLVPRHLPRAGRRHLGHRPGRGHRHAVEAGLDLPLRNGHDGRRGHVAGVHRGERRDDRNARGRRDGHRPVQVRVVDEGPGDRARPVRRLLEHGAGAQGQAVRRQDHRRRGHHRSGSRHRRDRWRLRNRAARGRALPRPRPSTMSRCTDRRPTRCTTWPSTRACRRSTTSACGKRSRTRSTRRACSQSVWGGVGESGDQVAGDARDVDIRARRLPAGLRRPAVVRSRHREGEAARQGRGRRGRDGRDARRIVVRRGAWRSRCRRRRRRSVSTSARRRSSPRRRSPRSSPASRTAQYSLSDHAVGIGHPRPCRATSSSPSTPRTSSRTTPPTTTRRSTSSSTSSASRPIPRSGRSPDRGSGADRARPAAGSSSTARTR